MVSAALAALPIHGYVLQVDHIDGGLNLGDGPDESRRVRTCLALRVRILGVIESSETAESRLATVETVLAGTELLCMVADHTTVC